VNDFCHKSTDLSRQLEQTINKITCIVSASIGV